MADLLLDQQSVPSTPAAGQAVIFVDTTAPTSGICVRLPSGLVLARTKNGSIAADATGFAADTYVTNSDLQIPSFGLQVRTKFVWQLSFSKTAASTTTPAYAIRIGTNRTTADTARLTLTGPAQTAVADIGTLNILVIVRIVSGVGTIQGTAWWDHRGTAANTTTSGTGFANDSTGHVEGTSATFDNSALAGSYVGLSIFAGATSVWTLTQVQAEADW